MTTINRAASSNAAVGTGWTSPTNAYADDGTLASFAGANGVTWTTDYGFADFTTGDIPDGSTINSVTMSANVWVSNATRGDAGVLGRNSGANSGSEATTTSTSTTNVTTATLSGITLADLRSASTLLKARVRCSRTASQAFTGSLDYVYITVDYTPGPTTQTSSFTVNALVKRGQAGSFTVNAEVEAGGPSTQTGSFTVNAEIDSGTAPEITWGLWSETWQNPISGGGTVVSGFTVDAVIRKPGNAGSFTVNALVKRSTSGSFTANAVLERVQASSFAVNAVIRRSQAGSFPVDALLKRSQTGSFTANAVVKRSQTGSFTVNAVVRGSKSGSVVLDAIVRKPGLTGSFTLNAVLRRPGAGSFTLAAIVHRQGTGAFTLNAWLIRKVSGSFIVNALIRRTQTASFAVDAWVSSPTLKVFTLDAVLLKHQSSGPAPFSPAGISGLSAWLDANQLGLSGGAAVSSWPNLAAGSATSVIGSPAMVFTAGAAPTGLPVVRFKYAEGRVRSGWAGSSVYDWTLVYLVRWVGPNAGRAFSVQYPPSNLLVGMHISQPDAMYDNGTWTVLGTGWSTWSPGPGPWRMYGADSETGQGSQFFIDGTPLGSRVTGVGGLTGGWALSGYAAGADTSETMDIEVAELVLYDRRLSDVERQSVEAYLQEKWITGGAAAGGPTIDAWIQKRVTATFAVNAVIRSARAGSFTVNALVKRTATASFTADAVIKRTASAATTVNAVIKATKSGSFTASALVKRTTAGSFLLDAVLKRSQGSSFTLNAVVRRGAAGSFTVNAIVRRPAVAAFTTNAVVRGAGSGSFTLNAVLRRGASGSFTVNAIARRPASGSFTLDAIRRVSATGSFTANAWLNRKLSGSFSLSAIVRRPGMAGSFTVESWVEGEGVSGFVLDAIVRRPGAGSFSLAAIRLKHQSSFSFGPEESMLPRVVPESGGSDGNIYVLGERVNANVDGHVTAFDYYLWTGASSTRTFKIWNNATQAELLSVADTASGVGWHRVLLPTPFPLVAGTTYVFSQDYVPVSGSNGGYSYTSTSPTSLTPSLTWVTGCYSSGHLGFPATDQTGHRSLDVVFQQGVDNSPRIDAWLVKRVTGSFTASAVIRRAQAGSFTANAWLIKKTTSSFTVSAIVKSSRSGSFTIDAAVRRAASGSFSVNATLLRRDQSGSFAVNAVIRRAASGTFPVDAVLRRGGTGSFAVDALVRRVGTGSFTLSSIVRRPAAGAFTVNAAIRRAGAGSFPVDAAVRRAGAGSFPVAAVVRKAGAGSFTLAAILRRQGAGAFTVDAAVRKGGSGSFTLSALIRRSQSSSFTVSALVRRAGAGSFTVNAEKKSKNSFTIDALIRVIAFEDNFNRVVASGLGSHYAAPGPQAQSAFVNGAEAQLPAATNNAYWNQYPRIQRGWIRFDFKTPSTEDYGGYFEIDTAHFGQSDGWPMLVDGWLEDPGIYTVEVYPGIEHQFPVSYATWYSVMAWVDYANVGAFVGLKVWKRGDPEPTAWTATGTKSFASTWVNSYLWLDGHNLELALFDNYRLDVVDWVDYFPFDSFTLDARIHAPRGSFPVDAVIRKPGQTGSFTLNARITRGGSFTLSALVNSHRAGSFTVDAFLRRNEFHLDAIVGGDQQEGAFYLEAFISRNVFTLDAYIRRAGSFPVRAVIKAASTRSFTVNAEVFAGTRLRSFRVDATIAGQPTSRWYTNAEIRLPHAEHVGEFEVEAISLDHMAGSFDVSARIFDGKWTKSFTLDADTKGQNEKRGTIPVRAIVRLPVEAVFMVEAEIGWQGYFHIDAYIRPHFRLDAEVAAATPPKGSFSLDARVTNGREFKVSALIKAQGGGAFGAGAEIWRPGLQEGRYFWLDASIQHRLTGSFTLNARIASGFTLDAFIRPYFTIDAYIRGNNYILWPDDGGPATDPDGVPLPPWYKASRKYRIKITIDGVDVTGDVRWSATTFTQNAKTNPGTFELVLYGPQPYDGGETVLVELDDFRTFGGYILSIERGYVFEADAEWSVTTLRGADFNILFDKLITYNRASADDPSGKYTPYKAFAKGSLDTRIIRKVFDSYIDKPAGLEYKLYVETAGVAAPEKPWAMPTSGAPLRQVMQSLSQVTNAVWWIDPYMHLHYGPRTKVTAPYPITDGLGGISSQNLSMTEDMSQLVTDGFLWGVLAYTVEGEIVVSRRKSSLFSEVGPFQYGEFRSDLHHERFIDRRIASVIERYGKPIKKAKAVIFEPGYQAGQVADVRLTEHGLTEVLVIQSMRLSIAVMKEPQNGYWYGVPRFELSIGLDPESPWDIYDYLPFGAGQDDDPTRWKRGQEDEDECVDENPPSPGDPGGCSAEICGITDAFSRTTSPWDGGYYEKHGGWGVSDQGTEWGGATMGSFVNGSAGVFRLEGHDSDPAAPPGWNEFDNVWSQQQYLNWQGTEPPMDVLLELQFSRALLPDDTGHVGNPDYWGEYLWIFFGDGAPHTSGKFEVTISGNVGMQLFLWSDDGETAWKPIPVDVTQPFYVRTTHPGPNTPISLWIWQKGSTQPTDPYLTLMGASSSNGGITIEAASNNVQQPLIEYRVLSLDVEGVDRCGGVQFDDFNRTVSDGLGYTADGVKWGPAGGTGSVSVNGNAAVFNGSPGQFRSQRWNYDELESAPWWDWSTPADPLRSATMRMRFWFDFVPPGPGQGFVRLMVNPGDGNGANIDIASTTNGDYWITQGDTITKTDWVRNRKYIAEWQFEKTGTGTGNTRFTVYEEGGVPGAWSELFVGPTAGDSMLTLHYDNESSSASKPVYVDYIEFDYEGKPCYQDCPPPPYDNFSRTVSNGWGSSGTGLVWTEEPDAHSGVDGSHSHFTVNGNYGIHNVDVGWTSTAISAPLGIGKTFKMRTLWRPARTGARLYFSPTPWGYYDGGAFEIQFTQPGASGTNAFVGMTNAAGFMTIPSWVLGANWLDIELTLTGGQATLRVQKAGIATIYSLGPANITSYSFSYINFSDGPFAVDYIDFEGGECNPLETCEELAVDTFDRTVPLGTTWGGEWGLPEVGWVNPPNMSVNGGIATMNDGNAFPYGANDPMLSLPDESSLPLEMLAQFRINTPTAGYDPNIENLDWSLYFYTRDDEGYLFRWGSVEIYMDDPGGGLWVTAIHSGGGSTLSTTEFQLPVGAWENRWLNIRLRVEPTQSMARVWAAGDDEPSSWPSVHSRSAPLDTSYGLVPSVQILGFGDGFSLDFESISIVHCDVRNASTPGTPGTGDPTGPGGPCEDVEGEKFGAVTMGWGCETLRVKSGIIELTGQAARSTLTLYDADTGEHIAEGWFEDQAGKTFRVPDGHTRVNACYRNYTPEIGSNPSVPRLTQGSVGRHNAM